MSTVINLFGGPGCGKSTVAAALFVRMKEHGFNCELLVEYIKKWAWDGRQAGPFDQLYVMAKQVRQETALYGKVDYIINDSPFLMSPVYEHLHYGYHLVLPTALRLYDEMERSGVRFRNYLLARDVAYDGRGRFESDESAAQHIDALLEHFLRASSVPYRTVEGASSGAKADVILADAHSVYRFRGTAALGNQACTC